VSDNSPAVRGSGHWGDFVPAYGPRGRGFAHQNGHYFGALDYFTHIRDGSHDWYRDDKELKEEGYSTHLVAREACRLIEGRDKTKPLFLYVPFNAVHAPLQAPDDYLKSYPALNGPRRKLAGMLSAADNAIGQIVASLDELDVSLIACASVAEALAVLREQPVQLLLTDLMMREMDGIELFKQALRLSRPASRQNAVTLAFARFGSFLAGHPRS